MATKTERSTAHHEAGHAVAGHVLGRIVEWATIEPTADARGMACATGGDARAQAICAIAGPLSDRKFWGSAPASEQSKGYGADFDQLEASLSAIHPHLKGSRDRGELLDDPAVAKIIDEAGDLVRRNWPAIQSLASRLIAQRSISGGELRARLAVLCRPYESATQTAERLQKEYAAHKAKLHSEKTLRTVRTASGEAEIFLYDEIGAFGVSAKEFALQLAGLGDVKEITLRLNSPGGDAFDGVAMFNSLVQHPAHVIVRVDGLAASAASLVAMAGDRIEMAENAFLMVHSPWALAAGNAREHREFADLLDKITEVYISAYANRRGINRETVSEMLWDETWLSADEAIEVGFADEVIETPAIAASVAKGRYQRTPASLLGGERYRRSSSTPRRDAADGRMREMRREAVAA